MAWLLNSGLIKAARWAKTLGEVARGSSLHLVLVRQLLERILGGEVESEATGVPRDVAKLVDLLLELSIEAGSVVEFAGCRGFLEVQSGGKGKASKLAKEVLLLEGDAAKAASIRREALLLAMRSRVERVRRWEGFVNW